MAIFYTTNPVEWKLTDSVIIAEQQQPSSGNLSNGPELVGIVGEFPWGPADTLLEFSSGQELLDQLVAGYSDPGAYAGWRALSGKTFGGPLRIVRAKAAAGAVNAFRTIADTVGPTDAVDLTAKYHGVAGNEVTTLWTNQGANFDLTITFGTIVETFEGVSFDAAGMTFIMVNSALVDAVLNVAGGVNPPTDVAAVALATGADGTLVDLDYTGSDSVAKGLRVLRGMEDGGFAFVAEYTSAAVITELLLHAAVKRNIVGAQADISDVLATNIAAAGALADERLRLFVHRAQQLVEGTEYTVDLTAFYASVFSAIAPNLSVAERQWRNPYLTPILGVPAGNDLIRNNWILADNAGGIMLEKLKTGGFKFHMDITSDPTDGATSSIRRRMHDFVNEETGVALEQFLNKPPTNTNRNNARAAVRKRLQTMQDLELIEAFSFAELARDGDSVTYETKVKLFGEMRYLINKTTVGENVVIEEAA